jgi:hypothetical protein
MSAPTGIRSGVGFRNCVIFALDANGYPAATDETPYEGTLISGVRTMSLNDPELRRIPNPGDDGIVGIDTLPPSEAITGELRTGKINDVVDALITGQKAFTVGEATLFGIGTEKRGFENQVAMIAYRQAQDTDPDSPTFGIRFWDFRILPKTILYTRETGYAETMEEHIYNVIPAKVTSHIWGTVFTEEVEGFVQSQLVRGVSSKKPKIVAWKGDGIVKEFLFPAKAQAVSTSKIVAWNNGTAVTVDLTKAVTGLTFTTAPLAGDIIVAFYEVK